MDSAAPAHSARPVQPTPQKLRVPRTPLESRQGYHPKMDGELTWRSPPSRQLSREKRVEYESDTRERFYDDYLGARTTGDARNEVLTTSELSKLKYDPAIYRANALQGLVYDPARVVPRGVNLVRALREEKVHSRQREMEQHHRRRMSDSSLQVNPQQLSYLQYYDSSPTRRPSGVGTLPAIPVPAQADRPRSALQKTLENSLNPEVVPAVETWFTSATNEDKEIAEKFFRTLSSHGKRPDPASRAALHRSRAKSAVMTPSRKQRQEREIQSLYKQMSRETGIEGRAGGWAGGTSDKETSPSHRSRYRRSSSTTEKGGGAAKGGMFATSQRQQPSHFTIHTDWASEYPGQQQHSRRK
jgi:hypothetical protein